ncbi:unnamed protein product [Rotaria socialis]
MGCGFILDSQKPKNIADTMQLLLLFSVCFVVSAHFQEHHTRVNRFSESKNLFDSSNVTRTQVLIIGAGLSGLEAARLLRENGVKTIVIEGRNRTGGRIFSLRTKNGHMIDLGGAWIHGINGSIPGGDLTNPIWEIARAAKIPTRSTPVDDLLAFYPANQKPSNVEEWFEDFVDYVREETKMATDDASFEYYANIFANMRNFTVQERYAFYSILHTLIEGNEATELDKIGAKNYMDITGLHYGEEHVFHETGFKAIIDYLTKDVKSGDIRLEQVVTRISYNQELAEVLTANGHVYQADFILLTVPLGVLKARKIEFSPPLPEWKLNAIDRLGYGILDKAILLWDKAWWDSTNYYFMRVSSTPKLFGSWVNANKWHDRPALFCFYFGEEAYKMETTLSDGQVVTAVRNVLQEMFPNVTIPMPIDSYITRWAQDPFSYGSYSHISVNQTHADMIHMSEPVSNQLLFAGEATATQYYGFSHGALLSGRREATRLLYVYGLLPDQTVPTSRSSAISSFHMMVIISFICLQLVLY